MDASQIEKLKALALAATPGKWTAEAPNDDGNKWHWAVRCPSRAPSLGISHELCRLSSLNCNEDNDAAFIAAFDPATVLELIAEVERLKNERDTLCHGYGSAASYAIELQGEIDRLCAAPAAGTVEKDAKPLAHGHRGDWYLMANTRLLLEQRRSKLPNWALAASLFATGSNSARQICVDAGIDPDSFRVGRAAIEADRRSRHDDNMTLLNENMDLRAQLAAKGQGEPVARMERFPEDQPASRAMSPLRPAWLRCMPPEGTYLYAGATPPEQQARAVPDGWIVRRKDLPDEARVIIEDTKGARSLTQDAEPTLFRFFNALVQQGQPSAKGGDVDQEGGA